MNDNANKRREWIKTAAIIFLTILLLLTFFSQTILNHSLPEVATKNITSGTITSKIRDGRPVESGDPYVIEIPSIYVGRKVSSIAHKVGDKVQKGDLLFTMADGDGAELESAKDDLKLAQDALKSAQDAYDDAILNAGITSADIDTAHSKISASSYRKKITDLQAQLKDAKDKVTPLETAVAQLEQAIADCSTQLGFEDQKKLLADQKVTSMQTVQAQAQTTKQTAEDELEAAKQEVEAVKAEGAALEASYAEDPESYEDIESERAKVAEKLEAAEKKQKEKEEALTKAEEALKKADGDVETALKEKDATEASTVSLSVSKQKADYEVSKYNYEKQVNAAKAEVDRIQGELNDLISKIGDVTNLQSLQDKIDEAKKSVSDKKKKVEELESETSGGEIVSDIAGTITAVNVTSGKQIENRDVMVLQPEGQGYYMSFSVTNEQARTVSVGDKASLVNAWYYNDLDITLQSIKPDKTEPGKKKQLTFAIDGEVAVGQTLNISVGQRSQNYDMIIPRSALKNDTNGDYVLIVESKSSPLGNRYIATRVDVTVLAQDDTQAAISGALNGWEYVITTATAPIKGGSQVRMSDN